MESYTRNKLIGFYKKIHEDNKGYGIGGKDLNKGVAEILYKYKVKTILDFGCGKGESLSFLEKLGFEATGYDPAIKRFEKFPEKNFDAVISLDVFEHLLESTLEEECERISKTNPKIIILNISTRKAFNKLPDGEQCHTLVKDAAWWKKELAGLWPEYKLNVLKINEESFFHFWERS